EGSGYIRRAAPSFGLRWITWPTNTFCAAVAWRNHPPAAGTPATVLRAVANLERVRALKRTAREARIEARHEQAMAVTRRRAELAAARSRTTSAAAESEEPLPIQPNENLTRSQPASLPASPLPSAAGRPVHDSRVPGAADVGEAATVRLRLPSTAATIVQWANTWVSMCADGDLVYGPLNDDHLARVRYD